MLSMPPATIRSASPARMACAASITALSPEPHTLLTVNAAIESGSPAFSAACRAGFCPTPAWITLPKITSSTWSSGARARLAITLPITVSVSGFPRPVAASLLDLSEGGCRIVARSILLTGSTVAFELPNPGKRAIPLRGTVRHIAPSRNAGEVEFGVEFGALARDDAAALAAFIEEKRRQGPGDARTETDFPVRCNVEGMRETFSAVALDLSRNGMRLEVQRQLTEDAKLMLRFAVPGFRERQVEVRVLRGLQRPSGSYHYSVLFLDPPADFMREIERFTASQA